MKKKVFSVTGEEIKDIELNQDVFGCKISEGSIYYAVNNELANRRVGTANTRTRGEVRGSSAKPWRQKGTGHARAGRRRSPLWTGGGIVFGPKPKDYSYSLPKKMKRLAMKSLLTMRSQDENLKIVEDFSVESGKTKELVTILKNFVENESTVIILADDDAMIRRAGANIPWVKFLSYNRLNAHDLFYGKKILMLESAAGKLNEFYAT